ncbi:MAG TPA: LysR family transcriptional regulator [Candidimonas sp.]|nr:LysR family transcriptional regulator [Candidimonas sp.]
MEIRQLEAFAAVCSHGSVTAAARVLRRSQSVVSRQIQDLEHELGFTLFTRTRPQVTITHQGRQFSEEARNVLSGLQHLETRINEISRGQSRPLRIATTYSLGAALVATVLGQMEKTAAAFDYKMHIDVMAPRDVVQAISDGQADVGVATLPLDLGRCHLHWSGQAPCVLAVPAGHRLASAATIDLDALGDTTVVTMSNRSGLRHRLATALLQNMNKPRRQVETSSYMNALMLVRAGVGVALMDPFTAHEIKTDSVLYRSIDRYMPYMIGVISHPDRVLHEDGLALVQAMWAHASASIPGFVRGDASGLPVVEPAELKAG